MVPRDLPVKQGLWVLRDLPAKPDLPDPKVQPVLRVLPGRKVLLA